MPDHAVDPRSAGAEKYDKKSSLAQPPSETSMEEFHMEHKRRIKGLVLRVLIGVFCFVLLAILLYTTQLFAAYQQKQDDAITELMQIHDKLASQPHEEEMAKLEEDFLRQNVQKVALLLSNGDISNEKLALIAEQEPFLTAMMVFREGGTLLYSCGDAQADTDFFCRLQERQVEKTEDGIPFLAMRLKDDLYLAIGSDLYVADKDYQKTEHDMSIVAMLADEMVSNIAVADFNTWQVLYGPDAMLGKSLTNFLIILPDELSNLPVMLIDHPPFLATLLQYDDYILLSLFNVFDLLHSLHVAVIPALLGFGFLIFLLLAYTEFIRMDMCKGWLGKIH